MYPPARSAHLGITATRAASLSSSNISGLKLEWIIPSSISSPSASMSAWRAAAFARAECLTPSSLMIVWNSAGRLFHWLALKVMKVSAKVPGTGPVRYLVTSNHF